MERIRHLVLDEPGLYLFGALGSALLLAFGLSFYQAAAILFWWYVICTATVGLYIVWCNFIALMISLVDKGAPPGWNWENCPSIQELKQENPVQARVLAEIWGQLDQTMWQSIFVRLLLIITIFVSLPLGAFFLRESIANAIVWWKLALALVLLAYGFVTHHRYNR